MTSARIVFVGGGNMAGAIIGGLVKAGRDAQSIQVVEPVDAQRARLQARYPVQSLPAADAALAGTDLFVWAVKPQAFREAAAPLAAFASSALHLSVMAGIRSDAIVAATGSERVVRAMPNTPALIGRGIAGLYARAAASGADRELAQRVLEATGECIWFDDETQLDAVTALSGSGPAYVFYLIEAMVQAAGEMGLSSEHARRLAVATVGGAAALAAQSDDDPAALRAQVTSKGGTTHAAIEKLDEAGVKDGLVRAIHAAHKRAAELGSAFGRA